MKFVLAYSTFLLSTFFSFAQSSAEEPITHQLSFTCDNDFFLFNDKDSYYTSGLFLRYDRLSKKKLPSGVKQIYSYEIGQLIFTAHDREILPDSNSLHIPFGTKQIDRPIAGYLFAKIARTRFYHDRKMLTLGVSLGTVGDNSFGRQIQEFWHGLIGVKNYWNWVWDYQVKNEVGLNLHGTFAQSLIRPDRLSFIQITPVTEATVGTIFTNFSQGVVLQLGKLRGLSTSGYWNSRLQSESSLKGRSALEFVFYYKPSLKYQLYNATIQGGFFNKDRGPIVAQPQPLVFSHEIGILLSTNRFCYGYKIAFQSKDAQGQFNQQWYASITAAYRF
jgi:hypothetical protein